MLPRRLHRPLPAQTFQPFSPLAAYYLEPSRGNCSLVIREALCLKLNINIQMSYPLQVPCANFEYMLWFESLLFYGFDEHSTLEKDDGDIGLLPAIVEKVILSKLSGENHTY